MLPPLLIGENSQRGNVFCLAQTSMDTPTVTESLMFNNPQFNYFSKKATSSLLFQCSGRYWKTGGSSKKLNQRKL